MIHLFLIQYQFIYTFHIPGLKLKVTIPIKQIIEKTGKPASELKHVPDELFVQINILDGVVCFQFPEEGKMDLLNIMLALVPKVPEFIFDKVLKKPPMIVIKRFDVDIKAGSLWIIITAPEKIVLGENLLEIKEAEFELKKKGKDSPWEFRIEATKEIAGTTMQVLVKKEGDEYVFKGKIN